MAAMDLTTHRAYTSDCREPRFLTFRLGLKGTGRDKKLETIFAFLNSSFFSAHGANLPNPVVEHTARTSCACLESGDAANNALGPPKKNMLRQERHENRQGIH